MKNKILSLVLSFAMVASTFAFSMQPVFAEVAAANENNTITNEEVQPADNEALVEDTNVVTPEENTSGEETQIPEVDTPVGEVPETEDNGPVENVQSSDVSEDSIVVEDSEAKNNVVVTDEPEVQSLSGNEKNENEQIKNKYKTIVFTDAGPFMPAVDVTKYFVTPVKKAFKAVKSFAAPEKLSTETENNGIELSKSAEKNPDGSYKITLEAYTTGKVTSTEITTPADICIVVDQSKSMLDPLGNSQKSIALENSLNNFVDNVHKKYNAEKADHRISIVGYGENQNHDKEYIDTGWHEVNATGVNALKHGANGKIGIDGMEYKWQNTDVKAGMKKAENLMGGGYKYSGPNQERQKVVILFTDGYPSTTEETPGVHDDYGFDIANAALISSDNLKDAGVTVYSVGMFNGANPNETYGKKNEMDGTDCYNKPDTSGYGKNEVWAYIDKMSSYNPAANRFLNYVSSNYAGSENARDIRIGDASQDMWNSKQNKNTHYYGFRVTGKPYNPIAEQNYYLTAKDEASLDDVFQTIVENVATPTIELGKEAVVKDIVTDYFDMPANVKDIKVYTAEYNGTSFKDRKPVTGLKVKMAGRTVEITGFDYNKNFVSKNAKADGSFGKKLIIEFNVTKRDGFLGGNQVPTNVNTSGIYKDGQSSKSLEEFVVPNVNVPLEKLTVNAPDKHIYLHGSITPEQLKEGVSVTFRGTPFDQLESWQKDYVKAPEVNITNGGVVKAESDSTYEAIAVLEPKYAESGRPDMEPVLFSSSDPATGNIFVYKPEVKFKDLNGYLGDQMSYLEKSNAGAQWKHNGTVADPAKMTGEAPALSYNYDKAGQQIKSKDDIYVKVKVNADGSDISKFVTFTHKDCSPSCGFDKKKGQFVVHVYVPEITYKDLYAYYGEKLPALNTARTKTEWKRSGKIAASGEMSGTKPDLTYSYDEKRTNVDTLVDIPVNVTVKSGTADLTPYVTFKHVACNPECGFNPSTEEFLVHVKTCTLKIKKNVTGGSADGQLFVMTVTGNTALGTKTMEFTVAENKTTVIKGLPTGTYTVKEQTGTGDTWTWRYNVTYSPDSAQLDSRNPEGTVVVNNEKTKNQWLNGYTSVENVFENVVKTVK